MRFLVECCTWDGGFCRDPVFGVLNSGMWGGPPDLVEIEPRLLSNVSPSENFEKACFLLRKVKFSRNGKAQ